MIVFFSLLPVEIWALMQPISTRFINFGVSMTSVGQLAALMGIVMLGITFLLNTRARIIESIFGGLDRAYKAHHLLGTFSFLFLLFHPIFLAVEFATFSINSALRFFIPGGNLAINAGIFSLLSMILFLIFTFFINLKYHKWKFVHRFLGLSLMLAAIHVFLISSDISRNIFLRVYIFAFIGVGLLSFSYRTLFYRFLVEKYSCRINGVRNLGNIIKIGLEPEKKIYYSPGQFVFVCFPEISREFHPFSIISSPEENDMSIAIKSLGDYTEKIQGIKPGGRALVEGPYGKFNSSAREQIWIAGGIGITPFLSMAKSLVEKKAELYYCVKNKEESVFLKELQDITMKNKNFKVFPFYSSESGFITAKFISNKTENIESKDILICGPAEMMRSLRRQFRDIGIEKSRIYSEEFKLL